MICVIVAYSFKRKLTIDLNIFILNLVISSFSFFFQEVVRFIKLYKNICHGTKRVICPPGFTISTIDSLTVEMCSDFEFIELSLISFIFPISFLNWSRRCSVG